MLRTGGGGGGGRVSLRCLEVTGPTKASLLDMVRPGVSSLDGSCGGPGIVSLDATLAGVWDSPRRLVMASHHPGQAVEVNTPVQWGASRLFAGTTLWVEEGGVALTNSSDQTATPLVPGSVRLGELLVGTGGQLSIEADVRARTTPGNLTLDGQVALGWNVTLESAGDVILGVRCVVRLGE